MSATLERDRTYAKYEPADVERGLQALALAGSLERASNETGIPGSTLHRWAKDLHAERYQAIREQVMPRIHAEIASESEDLARQWAELEREGLKDLKDNWTELKIHERSAALRNATVSRGISIDKASVLRGKPTSIVRHDVNEDIRQLQALGVVTVDSTATEVEDAQLIDD